MNRTPHTCVFSGCEPPCGGRFFMEIIGLKGERVRLVPPEPSLHLDNALRWMNDPAGTATLAENLGVTRRLEELFFEQIATEREKAMHSAIVAKELAPIGFIGRDQRH